MKNQDLKFAKYTSLKRTETLQKENQSLMAETKQAKAIARKATEEANKAKAEAEKAKAEAKKAKEETKKAEDKAKKAEDKARKAQKELKNMKRAERRRKAKGLPTNLTYVSRYKYTEEVIKICVLLYVRVGIGLRSIRKTLNVFSEVLGIKFGDIPSHQSILDWVEKMGLSVYEDDPSMTKMERYAAIQDECVGINGEKLLLTIGIPAEFMNRPVGHADASVLDMRVSKSFTGEEVKQALDDVALKLGQAPEYTITDQGPNLVKGMRISGVTHYIDVSHAIGTCFKKEYEKQPDFKEMCAELGKAHLKLQLTDSAYLLPPKLRAISRFMNLREWVKWAKAMIRCYDTLTEKEQEDYTFLLKYKSLFEELNTAIEVTNYVEDVLKNRGFDKWTANICKHHIIMGLFGNSPKRLVSLGFRLLEYIIEQQGKLPDESTKVNISTDIIESKFGFFKGRKSPNNLYGVTPLVLMVPLYSKLLNPSVAKTINFKERLTKTKLADVKAWSKTHLLDNKVTVRIKILNKGA